MILCCCCAYYLFRWGYVEITTTCWNIWSCILLILEQNKQNANFRYSKACQHCGSKVFSLWIQFGWENGNVRTFWTLLCSSIIHIHWIHSLISSCSWTWAVIDSSWCYSWNLADWSSHLYAHSTFLYLFHSFQPQLQSVCHPFEWRSPVPHCGGNASSKSHHGDRDIVGMVRRRRLWILCRRIDRKDRNRQGLDRFRSAGRRIHR